MKVENDVLNQIVDVLDCHATDVRLLGGYFDNVYEIAEGIVVKIFDLERDTEEQVLSEIEWTQFLKENGVNVTTPILVGEQSYIHHLTDKLFFVAYEKAKGHHIDVAGEVWNDSLFKQWGSGMGRMHFLSNINNGKYNRPEWNEHRIYQMSMDHFDAGIKAKWERYLQELKSMNKSTETYGIIHGDRHHHNFLYDKGALTFIDFGDSEFNWYAYDIAIAIYHAAQAVKDPDERNKFAFLFFKSFMDGYVKENSVNEKHIDFFINFRHLYSFVYHNQFLERDKLTKQQLQYLENMRSTIINQPSYLGVSLV